jgi:hypothetical protein
MAVRKCNAETIWVTIGLPMLCTEEERLRMLYYEALRRWTRAQSAFCIVGSDPFLRVQDEKSAAANRLEMHRQNCSRCRRATL